MKIAIIGATGLVGRKVLDLLYEKDICTYKDLTLFASKKSAGMCLKYGNNKVIVKELNCENIEKYDYAIFCAGGRVSKEFIKFFMNKCSYIIDNSSAFRRKKNVPLVVPEINFCDIGNKKLIANPNCSTIGASLPIFALSKKYEIKRIVVSTYQAVSGAGKMAIDDLQNNTTNKLNYQIANNLIPQIDRALKDSYTYEEDKMRYELQKILHKKINITTTCVRVPIINCHSESINIEFNKTPNLKTVKKLLNNMPGITLVDNLAKSIYPMPKLANNNEDVLVGRVRRDTSNHKAINLFISFDNILKGASLNAVQILQNLIALKK